MYLGASKPICFTSTQEEIMLRYDNLFFHASVLEDINQDTYLQDKLKGTKTEFWGTPMVASARV